MTSNTALPHKPSYSDLFYTFLQKQEYKYVKSPKPMVINMF